MQWRLPQRRKLVVALPKPRITKGLPVQEHHKKKKHAGTKTAPLLALGRQESSKRPEAPRHGPRRADDDRLGLATVNATA